MNAWADSTAVTITIMAAGNVVRGCCKLRGKRCLSFIMVWIKVWVRKADFVVVKAPAVDDDG